MPAYTILIVDDELPNLESLERILKSDGAKVETFQDPRQALDIGPDDPQVFPLRRRDGAGDLVGEDPCEFLDRRQRRAQLMADGRDEIGFHLVDPSQLFIRPQQLRVALLEQAGVLPQLGLQLGALILEVPTL